MLDNGYIDIREFLSLMVEEMIVLDHEVTYSGDTDEGSIEHLSLTMIMLTVVEEIIDTETPDFMNTFLDIVKVHTDFFQVAIKTHSFFREMLNSGRLIRTHEGLTHTHTQTYKTHRHLCQMYSLIDTGNTP
jgi:hypothetical protein